MAKKIMPTMKVVAEPGAIFANAITAESVLINNYQLASFILQSGQASKTAAVHTLTISESFSDGDTITINDTTYKCVASNPDATENEFTAGTASQVAAALKNLVVAVEKDFNVTQTGAAIVFTQKVAGVGDIPTVATGVEAAASIETTIEYDDGNEDLTITVDGKVGAATTGAAIDFLIKQVGSDAPIAQLKTKTVKVGAGQAYIVTVTADMLAGTGIDKVIIKTSEITGSSIPGSIICLQSEPRYTE